MRNRILVSAALILLLPGVCTAQGGPSGRTPEGSDLSGVLAKVKTSFELSDEQQKAVSELYREYSNDRKSILEEFPGEDDNDILSRQIEIRRLNRTIENKMIEILSPAQAEDFGRILEEHRSSMRDANRNERDSAKIEMIYKRLGLDKEQEEKVGIILDSHFAKLGLLMEDRQKDRAGMEAMRESVEKINDETAKKLGTVLTEDQMKEYLKIVSEERDRMKPPRRPPGGKGDRPEGGRPF